MVSVRMSQTLILALLLTVASAATADAQCITQIQYEQRPILDGIQFPGQERCYFFQGNVGDVVRLNKDWNNNQLNLEARIFDPGNTQICMSSSSQKQVTCAPLTQSGTYFLRMRDSSGNYTGPYIFQIKRLNALVNCSQLCYGFAPTTGFVGQVEEVCYKFEARRGSSVQITRIWNNNQVNLWSEILDSNGAQVAPIGHTQRFLFQVPSTAPALETYTLLVRDVSLHYSGSFSIQLQCMSTMPGCPCRASESHYGEAWPNSLGRSPEITVSAPPRLGTTITVMIQNSSQQAGAQAALLLGLTEVSTATSYGGRLLVNPASIEFIPVGIGFPWAIPNSPNLCDACFYFQALQSDANASHRIAFSRGLHLIFGT